LVGTVPEEKAVAPKRGYRKALPQRRECENITFNHEGTDWTASVGRYPDGAIGEVFLSSTKPGSEIIAMGQDASVAASIAFQYGAPPQVVAAGLSRYGSSKPQTAFGFVMDLLTEVKVP
jgi:ribonucleoside-diphosphate reductase alpha chain